MIVYYIQEKIMMIGEMMLSKTDRATKTLP